MGRRILVLAWPSRRAALVAVPVLGRATVVAEADASAALPADWAAGTGEVRLVVESAVLYRLLDLPGVSPRALQDAARFTAEPGLPLPLSELATVAWPMGRRRAGRIALAAIPSSRLDEAVAWARSIAEARIVTLPALAVIPARGGRWSGPGWAAEAEENTWVRVASGRSEAEARGALASSSTTVQDAPGAHDAEWRTVAGSDFATGAATAPPSRSWTFETSGLHVSMSHSDRPRRWPRWLLASALLLAFAAFALRHTAAQRRIETADRAIAAAFEEALPGSNPVAPAEQVRRALANLQREHGTLATRLARRGSALSTWMVIDRAAPASGLRLDDLRITASSVQATGSATGPEVIQEFLKQLSAGAAQSGEPIAFPEPETRRSPAGLGVDFSLRGTPAGNPDASTTGRAGSPSESGRVRP